jgi:DNA polymerase III subunit epsilon
MRFAVIDTETSGLDPQVHSLLTIGVVVLDLPSGVIVAKTQIAVKEDLIVLDKEAMAVNRIDMTTHGEDALTPTQAADVLSRFLTRHFGGRGLIRFAGHNTAFDLAFLQRLWRLAGPQAPRWPFDFRVLDTVSLGYADILADPDRPNDSPSLDRMLHKFGITMEDSARHTAIGDALATARLLTELVNKGRTGCL